MTDIQNLGDVRALLQTLPAGDVQAAENARAREPQLTKPGGSLGRLEDIAEWLATWQGRHPARVERIKVAVFAGNHGVTAQGVSAFPPEVTFQMVANFEAGGAAINQLCGVAGADLEVVALDLDNPTRDFSQEPAMDDAECTAAFRRGMEAVGADYDVICLGEMGIGNTTPAAAIAHAIHGGEAGDWVGPGTGVEGDALALKVRVVADAVQRHKPAFGDGLDVLASVGGRELAAIAGAITQARLNRQPVVLDGYVCGAAAAALAAAAASTRCLRQAASLHSCSISVTRGRTPGPRTRTPSMSKANAADDTIFFRSAAMLLGCTIDGGCVSMCQSVSCPSPNGYVFPGGQFKSS